MAASLVVAHHFGLAFGFDGLPGPMVATLRHGYLAVDLFFVLSGFVMAMTYGAWFSTGSAKASYALFLMRRIGRLYPLYLIGLLASCLALTIMPVFRARLTAVIDPPAWSLSTEWAAYIAFPLLYTKTLTNRYADWLLAAVAIAVLAYGYVHAGRGYTLIPLLRCLAGFTLGALTYKTWPHVRHIVANPVACPLVSIIILALTTFRVTDTPFILLFPVLILTLAEGNGPVQMMLSSRIPYALGVLSYSIYLLHDILIGSAVNFITETHTSIFFAFLGAGLFATTVLLEPVHPPDGRIKI